MFPESFSPSGDRKNHPVLSNLTAISGRAPTICANVLSSSTAFFSMYCESPFSALHSIAYFLDGDAAKISGTGYLIEPLPATLIAANFSVYYP